ncbi:hypothetical protein [Aureimonas sp. ME7]|uniref:hypothetical protein n=1 Tax=Aureimonas sp. ME7 TaxID=2744252 RepID=UPI0015FD95A2|nr:hypothetical protein [Aureimonas sp. ME7]
MTGQIENATHRTLTHVLGHDGAGLFGRQGVEDLLRRPLSAPRNRRVIAVGDSFMFRHTFSSGNGVWNALPGGAGNRYLAVGELNWLRYLTHQSFDFDGSGNYGIVGQKTAEIAARLPAILALDEADTIVMPCSINGFLVDNPDVVTQELAALDIAYQLCRAAGRFLILETPSAGGDGGGGAFPNANMNRARLHVRRTMREIYRGRPGVVVTDMEPGYANPASGDGRALDGMVTNRAGGAAAVPIHTTGLGAYRRALRLLPIFLARFPQASGLAAMTNTDNYDVVFNPGGSRNSNPALDAGGGTPGTGGTGTLASGWSGGHGADTGHTRAYSKATGPNTGRPVQRIVLGGTMMSNAEVALLLMTLAVSKPCACYSRRG